MIEAVNHILLHCGNLKSDEIITILSDSDTKYMADLFEHEAGKLTKSVAHFCIDNLTRHGQDPPSYAATAMIGSDLIVSLCTWSLAHSSARIAAAENGARFLSLPFYSEQLLNDPSIRIDYKACKPLVERVTKQLTAGNQIHITSPAGTDIKLNITGRVGNSCPGIVEGPGELGSPPDVEANIAPLESDSNGVVCIDGSVTCKEIGLLKFPIYLTVEHGRIIHFEGDNSNHLAILDNMMGRSDSPRRVLAECGIGLNPLAQLSGTMLTDEGSMGSVHFGFGSNSTIGGQNRTDFHLDFVFKEPDLTIDHKKILERGEVCI